jgi:HK97 family phage portal protein
MGTMRRAAEWLGLIREDTSTGSGPLPGVVPPTRATVSQGVSPARALSIISAYRAVQVLCTAASQLTLDAERHGFRLASTPMLLRKPEHGRRSASGTTEYLVSSLALRGNAFLRLFRLSPLDRTSSVTHVEVLDPGGVIIWDDPVTGARTYDVVDDLGRHYTLQDWEVLHLQFMRVPGNPYGLGPIQAAQVELAGVIDTRDYASEWFDTSGVPSGHLVSDQHLNKVQADEYREMWDSVPAGRTRVTGAGLKYERVSITPKDAQFLETRSFDTTAVARLFGIPSSLMLASVEGTSQTYANVEQEWIAFTRFTLMAYLREIEEAFSTLLPNGQVARFNTDALLRTDTLTRYQAHEIAIRAGFMSPAYVARIEGIPPEALPAAPAPTAEPAPEAPRD